MTRIRVSLVLLAAALLIAACAQQPMPAPPVNPMVDPGAAMACSDTAKGGGNADSRVVCVDDSGRELKVDPDPFKLHETHSRDGNASPAVHFVTRSGKGDLNVQFKGDCVRNIVCNGGRCSAVPVKLNKGEEERRCKYDVMLTGHPTLDPEGVIVRCCVSG